MHSPNSAVTTVSGRGPLLVCNTLHQQITCHTVLADQTELWELKAIINKIKHINKANESLGTRNCFRRPAYHRSYFKAVVVVDLVIVSQNAVDKFCMSIF